VLSLLSHHSLNQPDRFLQAVAGVGNKLVSTMIVQGARSEINHRFPTPNSFDWPEHVEYCGLRRVELASTIHEKCVELFKKSRTKS
jgi:hypothetical protein